MGKLEGLAHGFAVASAAERAGYVHLLLDHVAEELLGGFEVGRITGLGVGINDAAEQEGDHDRVAGDLFHAGGADMVDEVAGEVQVLAVAGFAVQLDEGHFDHRVAGSPLLVAGAENGVDVISDADGDLDETVFAGGAVVGDGALNEVAGRV